MSRSYAVTRLHGYVVTSGKEKKSYTYILIIYIIIIIYIIKLIILLIIYLASLLYNYIWVNVTV